MDNHLEKYWAAHISGMNDYYEVKRMDYADECIEEREADIARLEREAQKQERLFQELLEDDTTSADMIQDYGLEGKLGDMVRAFKEMNPAFYSDFAFEFNQALLDALRHRVESEL